MRFRSLLHRARSLALDAPGSGGCAGSPFGNGWVGGYFGETRAREGLSWL